VTGGISYLSPSGFEDIPVPTLKLDRRHFSVITQPQSTALYRFAAQMKCSSRRAAKPLATKHRLTPLYRENIRIEIKVALSCVAIYCSAIIATSLENAAFETAQVVRLDGKRSENIQEIQMGIAIVSFGLVLALVGAPVLLAGFVWDDYQHSLR
jgi:hypothetical protein